MNRRTAFATAGFCGGARHPKVIAAIVAMLFLLIASADAQASSYYVSAAGSDANPGTIAQPFGTIRRGLGTLQPGDVLYIRGGVYTEHLVENDFAASGWSSAWITVAGYPGESVTIRNAGAGEIIRFQDGSKHHIEFRDLSLDGSSHDDGYGIVVIGYPGCCGDRSVSHDLKFTSVEVRDTWNNGIIGGGSSHQFINMNVHGTGRVPPEVYSSGANGVYFTGEDSLFEGGDYHDNLCWGIRIADSDLGHRAARNVVSRVRVYGNGTGKGLGGASRCGADGGGLVVGDSNNTVMNSLIYNNHTGIDVAGLHGKMVQGINIFNNTIYGNRSYAIGVGLFAGAMNTTISNNLLRMNGTAISEFSALNTVQSNNLTLDPGFVDASSGDFRLRPNSPAIDGGISLQGVLTDFDGGPRPRGQGFDVGAFEFDVVSASPASFGPPAPPRNVRILR